MMANNVHLISGLIWDWEKMTATSVNNNHVHNLKWNEEEQGLYAQFVEANPIAFTRIRGWGEAEASYKLYLDALIEGIIFGK